MTGKQHGAGFNRNHQELGAGRSSSFHDVDPLHPAAVALEVQFLKSGAGWHYPPNAGNMPLRPGPTISTAIAASRTPPTFSIRSSAVALMKLPARADVPNVSQVAAPTTIGGK